MRRFGGIVMRAKRKALRDPPAFQTYASDDLASSSYYSLTLSERGLLDAMRRVIWCDGRVASEPEALSLAVRRPRDEVVAAFTQRVQNHFVQDEDGNLICPVLAGQKAEMIERREKQSVGGKKGGTKGAQKRASDASSPASLPASSPASSPSRSPSSSRDERSGVESNPVEASPVEANRGEASWGERRAHKTNAQFSTRDY
jgi:hypothetical protein